MTTYFLQIRRKGRCIYEMDNLSREQVEAAMEKYFTPTCVYRLYENGIDEYVNYWKYVY